MAALARSDFRSVRPGDPAATPYPDYGARMRTAGPRGCGSTNTASWAVPRYDDIKTIFADHSNFSNAGGAGLANHFREKSRWRPPSIILEADPPLHTRTREKCWRGIHGHPARCGRLEEAFKARARGAGRWPHRKRIVRRHPRTRRSGFHDQRVSGRARRRPGGPGREFSGPMAAMVFAGFGPGGRIIFRDP